MSSLPSVSQLAFDSAMDSLQSVECLHCIYWPPVTAHINADVSPHFTTFPGNTSNNRYEITTCEGLHTRCSSSPSFHSYSAEGMSDGWQICLQLRDIARQKDSNRLRTPSCPQTSIFIVCFSTVSPANFDNFQTEVFQTSQL
jgi:hypothetical protein